VIRFVEGGVIRPNDRRRRRTVDVGFFEFVERVDVELTVRFGGW